MIRFSRYLNPLGVFTLEGLMRGRISKKTIRPLRYLICSLVFLFILNCSIFAQSVKIIDLIDRGDEYDDQEISVEGEAIGHLMRRGEFVWLNIDDRSSSLGIWVNFDLATQIKYLGRHAITGDWIKVEGVFHAHCPIHGGDTDIHADKITIVERGKRNILSHDPQKVNILIFLSSVLLCLYIIKILKKAR